MDFSGSLPVPFPNSSSYICVCGVKFRTLTSYMIHHQSHKEEGTYRCPFPRCGKIFSHLVHLNKHVVIHTSPYPHRCRQLGCQETFATYSELIDHTRTHVSQKEVCPYVDCFAVLKSKKGLRQHIRMSHLKEKSYVCQFRGCEATFSTNLDRQIHLEKFHPQICPYEGCGQTYKHWKGLNYHLKAYHEVRDPLIPPMRFFVVKKLSECFCGKKVTDLKAHVLEDHQV